MINRPMIRATLIILSASIVAGTSAFTAGASTTTRQPGMGSTVVAWKHAYGVSRGPGALCSAKYSCFGPTVTNDDSGRNYRFADVDVSGGVIAGYQENFPRNTTLAEVETAIARTLPSDAHLGPVVVDMVGGTCGLINFSSPTLMKELNTPKIGDTTGTVGIELQHITANLDSVYNPNNIQTATVSLLPFDPTQSC